MESCRFAAESPDTADSASRTTSETAVRRHSCSEFDMEPSAFSEPDDDGDGERGRQQFVIPRKKEASCAELLQRLNSASRDGKDVQSIVYESMRKSESHPFFIFQDMYMVKNQVFLKQYHARRHEMKEEGRTASELVERYGFILTESFSKVTSLCKSGLSTESQEKQFVLGDPTYGVYLCKHSDVVSREPLVVGGEFYLVVFKFTKGRVKGVNAQSDGHVVMEPTPNFDCHALRSPLTDGSLSHSQLYDSCQMYLYEFGELDMAKRPRQCVPYAVVKFTVSEEGSKQSRLQENEPQSLQSPGVENDGGVLAWQGPLYNKNKYLGHVGVFYFSHEKLPLSFGKALNMKAKVTFEKLASVLPQPVFLAGPPYRVRQGAVVRGSNCYHYCQIRAQRDCDGNVDKLIHFLLDNSWAGMAEVGGATKLYILPTSDFTTNLGITDVNDNLCLHGLFSWKSSLLVPMSQVVLVTSEGNNLSMAKKPKFEAPFSSGESVCAMLGKQALGTSERATWMDDIDVADIGSPSDVFLTEQTQMHDDHKTSSVNTSSMMPGLERRTLSSDCELYGNDDELDAVRTSGNESIKPARLAVDESEKRLNANGYSRESALCTNTVDCREDASVPVADVCSDNIAAGVIFSPDASSQSDRSSPVKCGVEVTKRSSSHREVKLLKDKETKKTLQSVEQRTQWKIGLSSEEQLQLQPDILREVVEKAPKFNGSDRLENLSRPGSSWSRSKGRSHRSTSRRRRDQLVRARSGISQECPGKDSLTGKNSVSSAPDCSTRKTESLDPPKRGRPRGRPPKRKRVVGANLENALTPSISEMPEECSETIATSNAGKITRGHSPTGVGTTCSSSAELHLGEAGLVNTASCPDSFSVNREQHAETTGRELSVTLRSSVQCNRGGQFSECVGRPVVVTVDNVQQQLTDLSTKNHASVIAAISDVSAAGSVKEKQRQATPTDPFLQRGCSARSVEELPVTTQYLSKHCSEQHSVPGTQSGIRRSMEENGQSDVSGDHYVKFVVDHDDLTLHSQFDVNKGSRAADKDTSKERCLSEQTQLAETRMQLWFERYDDVGVNSSPTRPKSRLLSLKPPKNVPGCFSSGDNDKGTCSLKGNDHNLDGKEIYKGSEICKKSSGKEQLFSTKPLAAAVAASSLKDLTSNFRGAERSQSLHKIFEDNKQILKTSDYCFVKANEGERLNRWNDKHKGNQGRSSKYCSSLQQPCCSETEDDMKAAAVADENAVSDEDNNKTGKDNCVGRQFARRVSDLFDNLGESDWQSPFRGQGDWSTNAVAPESAVPAQCGRWISVPYSSHKSAIRDCPFSRDASTQTEYVRCEYKEIATQTEYGGNVEPYSLLAPTSLLQFSSHIPLSVTVKDIADTKSSTCCRLTDVVEKFERTVMSGPRTSTPQLEEQIEEYLSSARKEAESCERKVRHADSTVEDISPAVSPTEGITMKNAKVFSFPASGDLFESFCRGNQLPNINTGPGQSPVGRRKRRKRWDVMTSEVEKYDAPDVAVDVSRKLHGSLWYGHVETRKQDIMGIVPEKLPKENILSDQADNGLSSFSYCPHEQVPALTTLPTLCRSIYPPGQHTEDGDSTPPLEDYDDYDEADELNRNATVFQSFTA